MGKTFLPPGFCFYPTDLELSVYYLKRKIMGKPFRFEAISEIELYKFAPRDLPGKSCLQSNDQEWYFFCPGDRKYSNSSRKNRATDSGYWKTTGKDRSISYNSRIVARKKALVFHVGKVPQGERTGWVIHEYRLEDKELVDAGFFLEMKPIVGIIVCTILIFLCCSLSGDPLTCDSICDCVHGGNLDEKDFSYGTELAKCLKRCNCTSRDEAYCRNHSMHYINLLVLLAV